jgi:hypothetical protein
MKRILPIIFILVLTSSLSCKKLIEKKQRDAVIEAMTSGRWLVEQYFESDSNITYVFLNYEFQFYENGTVKGMLGTNVADGTWAADVDKYTITSEFPAAGDPLIKLNFTWVIKDSYWDFVKAEAATPAGKNVLHLRKKS